MKTKIIIGLVLILFGLTFLIVEGILAAKKSSRRYIKASLVLSVDGAEDPKTPPETSPVIYEVSGLQLDCEDIHPSFGHEYIIQHDQFGSTYYDYQSNGSMGRMIAVGSGGHRHAVFHESRGPYPTNPRFVTYNCKDPLNTWLESYQIDGGTNINAGYPNIAVMQDGRAVVIYHRPAGSPKWYTTLAVGDSICGSYFANLYDLPDWLQGAVNGMWSKMGIVYDADIDTDYIHIVMTEGKTAGGNQRLGYLRCHLMGGDTLLCETPLGQTGVVSPVKVSPNTAGCGTLCPIAYFGECEASGVPPAEYPNTISAVVATSPVSQSVAVVYPNKRQAGDFSKNNDVLYFESTNNGVEWFPQFGGIWPPTLANGMVTNVTQYTPADTERAYVDVAACYDYNDNLHILWIGGWIDTAAGLLTADANLYHWSEATGISMVASGYWDGAVPGGWCRNVCKMSISAPDPIYHPGGDPDSVYLFCIWTQFNPGDNALNGFTNGDIYATVSIDGGQTWAPGFNLTNTHTPDCAPGECLSEHWSSMADNMYDGDLHIQYVCDRDAGGVIQDEGAWTDNPMMYLHLEWGPPRLCGVSIELLDPPDWCNPPLKVLPGEGRVIAMRLTSIYTGGGYYEVTTDNPNVVPTADGSGYLSPQEEKTIELTIYCPGEESFLDVTVYVRYCIWTETEDTLEIKLYVVQSEDYYECARDSATFIEKDNGTLKLWACVNTSEELWDKRIEEEQREKVIFSGGVIVATTSDNDTVVGRQEFKDMFTGARDTINVVWSSIPHPFEEPECILQKVHVKNTYIWYPKVINPATGDIKWWWIDLHKQIIFFKDRPGYECPNWKKEQVIKYVWITYSQPPGWWPNPGTYQGHEDIYFGLFADIDAPYDTGCYIDGASQTGCNSAGWDDSRKLIYQSGYWNRLAPPDGHPEYANHYVGLALTDPDGAVVNPYGVQDVPNDSFLYPQGGWGWKDGELYQLASTQGVNIHDPSIICDRSVVMSVKKINASTNPDDIKGEFILIEASIPTGLADLQAHIDQTRSVLIPELWLLGLLYKKFPICGDCFADDVINSADVICMLGYLWNPSHPLPRWPFNRIDVTNNGIVDVADIIGLLNYLYLPSHPALRCSGFGR